MKLSLLHVKLFHDKKPNPILKTRTKRAKTKSKEVLTKPIPNSCGSMDTASNVEAETNDSASSMSFNEFETFADEVNGDIPEVDYRGRVKSEKLPSDVYESSNSLSQSQLLKSDRTPNFIKSLLSTRTPYEEFHRLFKSVPMDQFPINDFSCALSREILLQGRIYITQGWFCFYSNIFGWETQVTIDCTKIQSITREKTAYVVPNAILICTDEEKHFFSSFLSRETVYKLLLQVWDEVKAKNQKMDEADGENQQTEAGSPSEDKDVWEDEDEDEEQNIEGNDDEDHECSAGGPGEHAGHCKKCEQARKASSENLSRIKDVDEEGKMVMSKRGGHISHLGEKSSVSRCQDPAKITGCAGAAMFLASVAETVYSYFQVSLRLVRRLTREQLFYITTCFLITCLIMCSLFLLQRISILEPKIMAQLSYPPEKILLQKSMHQLWKLRQEVFDAEIVRFKTIVAANLNAITQVRQTLKMLEDDLDAHMSRNCTLLANNVCVQI
ncbi:GRAM domain-containing protein 2B isoform X1 [Pocillopora verrucosa]|uniref:GRAM domain-containing protein 2B-like isoform X1 n=2 Tax=Pocillopora damicornis TaxID=46731 RepID=UPI000F5521C3|nr:GRAM domain-containing protein 2B-like isoform X1 [Pocillopora damicornis]